MCWRRRTEKKPTRTRQPKRRCPARGDTTETAARRDPPDAVGLETLATGFEVRLDIAFAPEVTGATSPTCGFRPRVRRPARPAVSRSLTCATPSSRAMGGATGHRSPSDLRREPSGVRPVQRPAPVVDSRGLQLHLRALGV